MSLRQEFLLLLRHICHKYIKTFSIALIVLGNVGHNLFLTSHDPLIGVIVDATTLLQVVIT